MNTIHIEVQNKRLTYSKRDGDIICGNNDYQLEFTFDEEWNAHAQKIARFIIPNGKATDVPFSGNTCKVPMLSNVTALEVGVFVEDELSTTTVIIPCELSVRCKVSSENFVFPEYNGETELLVPTVSGVWVFGEGAPYTDGEQIDQSVNFVCDGINCNFISAQENGLDFQPIGTEIDNYVYDSMWIEEAYRTVDFGTTPQEVSEEFYAWFTANAVKQ